MAKNRTRLTPAEINTAIGGETDYKPRFRTPDERIEEAVKALEYAEQEIVHLRQANVHLRTQLDVWDKALNLINGQDYWRGQRSQYGVEMARDRVSDLRETVADLRNLIAKEDK